MAQPRERSFHCVGEADRGERIDIDGDFTVDDTRPSAKRFAIGTVVVSKSTSETIAIYPASTVRAEFTETAIDLKLRGWSELVDLRTSPRGRAEIAIRQTSMKSTSYAAVCRFISGRSMAVQRALRDRR